MWTLMNVLREPGTALLISTVPTRLVVRRVVLAMSLATGGTAVLAVNQRIVPSARPATAAIQPMGLGLAKILMNALRAKRVRPAVSARTGRAGRRARPATQPAMAARAKGLASARPVLQATIKSKKARVAASLPALTLTSAVLARTIAQVNIASAKTLPEALVVLVKKVID